LAQYTSLLLLVAMASVARLVVGQAAPAFEALTHTGEKITNATFKGKQLLLWFYPRASTPG
jgi:peroxiredoxin Q/BCP